MAKFVVESVYRNIAVHPLDSYLLGLKWRNSYYMNLVLTFRLCSAPAILNSVADVVEWILVNNYGIDDLLQYLDDFILAAPANFSICKSNLHVTVSKWWPGWVPLHPQKCLGPASCMVVLGIELDTLAQIARLPSNLIRDVLSQWSTSKCCKKKELQSLIGLLHHACMVVWPGCTFSSQNN